MPKRAMIRIDEDKCNGCGLCVPSCAEGALRIIDGKARVVAERFCDGLGACLGDCPQGALTVEEQDVEDFDLDATLEHVTRTRGAEAAEAARISATGHGHQGPGQGHAGHAGHGGGCPGAMAMTFERKPAGGGCPGSMVRTLEKGGNAQTRAQSQAQSQLAQWPVQFGLVPVNAPYLKNANLLITADCVPYAMADYHDRYLAGRAVMVGCPKLDDTQPYIHKLAEVIKANDLEDITVLIMEVPCCRGMAQVVSAAVALSGMDVPVKEVTVSLQGEVIREQVR